MADFRRSQLCQIRGYQHLPLVLRVGTGEGLGSSVVTLTDGHVEALGCWAAHATKSTPRLATVVERMCCAGPGGQSPFDITAVELRHLQQANVVILAQMSAVVRRLCSIIRCRRNIHM